MADDNVMWDPTRMETGIYAALDDSDDLVKELSKVKQEHKLEVRKKGLDALTKAWAESQKKSLIPVIGKRLPVLFDPEGAIGALYVVDTCDMEGYELSTMIQRSHPIQISSMEVQESSSVVLKVAVDPSSGVGAVPPIDIHVHPLLQIVVSIPSPGEEGFLIAARRVLDPMGAGGLPAHPNDLRRQKFDKGCVDVKALLEPKGFENDQIIPLRASRKVLADYSQLPEFEAWHSPGMITHYHENGRTVETNKTLWSTRWKQVELGLATPWSIEITPAPKVEIKASKTSETVESSVEDGRQEAPPQLVQDE